ncbi:Inositol-pentakisphosphate 2-kinase [Rhizophlyctis rosea]|uniref:Inositol-pentakisphosphate 2-kinase n=1 Tax=Rhizophlyctis rosea TaxID=64517 RepID=A0AAD5SJW6_9FUNG|nr:Inositol-pentakisphosphate 2-kinase [Rhizophlyctis rosea]
MSHRESKQLQFESTPDMPKSQPLTYSQLLDPAVWSYKAEGNANVVLTYVGRDSAFFGYVLRLRKEPAAPVKSSGEDAPHIHSLDHEYAFQRNVIGVLLGKEYVAEMQPVPMTREFLTAIGKVIDEARPQSRRGRGPDMNQSVAPLLPDHTLMQEVFAANSVLDSSAAPPPPSAPPTVVALELKVEDDELFCPLDLYSGDVNRVKSALQVLCQTPQNNLRFFLDGAQYPVDNTDTRARLDLFLSGGFDKILDLIAKILIDDPLFRVLKTRQQSLDAYDIEWIFKWYSALAETGKEPRDPTEEEWEAIVQDYLDEGREGPKRAVDGSISAINADAGSFDSGSDTEAPQPKRKRKDSTASIGSLDRHSFEPKGKRRRLDSDTDPFRDEISDAEKLHRVQLFMLSVTLKDLSVIITVDKDNNSKEEKSDQAPHLGKPMGAIRLGNESFRYKLRVVDIDPKRIDKISHYYQLDQDIIRHFQTLKEDKRCQP